MAAQLRARNGRSRRRVRRCRQALATILAAADSPSMRTGSWNRRTGRSAGAGAGSAGCRRSGRGPRRGRPLPAGRKTRAWRRSLSRSPGSQGLPTKSMAPGRGRGGRFPRRSGRRTTIFRAGAKARRSPIRAKPSSGRWGRGRPRQVDDGGFRRLFELPRICRQWGREWLVRTKSRARAKPGSR